MVAVFDNEADWNGGSPVAGARIDVTSDTASASLGLLPQGEYAIRLFHKGIPSDIGARLMGHSEAVHRNTYKRWYDAKEITKLRDHYTL